MPVSGRKGPFRVWSELTPILCLKSHVIPERPAAKNKPLQAISSLTYTLIRNSEPPCSSMAKIFLQKYDLI